MADPLLVACPVDTWVLVATNVTRGNIDLKDSSPNYKRTYRDTGNPAPTNDDDALDLPLAGAEIDNDTPIDVYVKAKVTSGSVLVQV